MAIVSHDGHNSETTTEPSHLVERKEGVKFHKTRFAIVQAVEEKVRFGGKLRPNSTSIYAKCCENVVVSLL